MIYYTPEDLVSAFRGVTIYWPTMGTGALLLEVVPFIPELNLEHPPYSRGRYVRERPHISADPDAAISLREASVYLGCDYVYILDMIYHPGRITVDQPVLESFPKPGTRNRRVTTRALCDRYRTALAEQSAIPPAGVSQTPASTAPSSSGGNRTRSSQSNRADGAPPPGKTGPFSLEGGGFTQIYRLLISTCTNGH